MCSQLPGCVCDAENHRGPRYEIKENKLYSFDVYDHLDRGKKIANFLYFKDAMTFVRAPRITSDVGGAGT